MIGGALALASSSRCFEDFDGRFASHNGHTLPAKVDVPLWVESTH